MFYYYLIILIKYQRKRIKLNYTSQIVLFIKPALKNWILLYGLVQIKYNNNNIKVLIVFPILTFILYVYIYYITILTNLCKYTYYLMDILIKCFSYVECRYIVHFTFVIFAWYTLTYYWLSIKIIFILYLYIKFKTIPYVS